uniref:Uncharacterized protein n=1 Tax=Oryza punctata TaxID=4537 RepID=A0A0E0MED5_ORYPU
MELNSNCTHSTGQSNQSIRRFKYFDDVEFDDCRFPLYPKQLTKFSDLALPEHRNKTFVDIAGVIVYLGPLQCTFGGMWSMGKSILDSSIDVM